MTDNTRQYAPTVDGITKDHIARYIFAAKKLPEGSRVLDLACGCGYGSWTLHTYGMKVTGIDIDPEAIEYAEKHYKGPEYKVSKAEDVSGEWDVVVSMETLEHLEHPEVVLNVPAKMLMASVPNEEVYPFSPEKFSGDKYPHRRHYTPKEFEDLLNGCGYKVVSKYCQLSKADPRIIEGTNGRVIIYIATK